ncbi:MAG: RluA family pseudouridine synthase [Anaerolineales bacterium]
MNERQVRFEVPLPGGRLDLALVVYVPDLSRTRIQRLIRSGLVKIDGLIITKPGFRLNGGEVVEILIPAPTPSTLQAEKIPIDIIFETEDLLLVNKPAGMVVHPSVGHDTGTLVHAALAHSPEMEGVGGEIRPGVVHRLDKDTSGLIILAKNDAAHHELQQQFKDRSVEKVYLALVDGQPPTPSGRIEAYIGRDPRYRKRMAVVHSGKGREAITIYHTKESFSEHSLLEVHPKTGRTHQIRVHLAYIQCPVVGDREYGRKRPTLPIERQFLHAASLTIRLPGESTSRRFEAPLPSDLEAVLDDLHRS